MRSRILLCVFGVSLFLFGLSRGYPDELRKNVAQSTRFFVALKFLSSKNPHLKIF